MNAENYVGTKPKPVDKLSTCPSTAPFFDGKACVACLAPHYFDFNSDKCLTCGKDFKFDEKDKICKPINNSVSPQYPTYNSNIG